MKLQIKIDKRLETLLKARSTLRDFVEDVAGNYELTEGEVFDLLQDVTREVVRLAIGREAYQEIKKKGKKK